MIVTRQIWESQARWTGSRPGSADELHGALGHDMHSCTHGHTLLNSAGFLRVSKADLGANPSLLIRVTCPAPF